MSSSNLTASIRKAGSEKIIVDLVGAIDAYAEGLWVENISYAKRSGAGCIILNFRQVVEMNSSGLTGLVKQAVLAQRMGLRLSACGLSPQLRQVFEITHLDDVIGLYSEETEALAQA